MTLEELKRAHENFEPIYYQGRRVFLKDPDFEINDFHINYWDWHGEYDVRVTSHQLERG